MVTLGLNKRFIVNPSRFIEITTRIMKRKNYFATSSAASVLAKTLRENSNNCPEKFNKNLLFIDDFAV